MSENQYKFNSVRAALALLGHLKYSLIRSSPGMTFLGYVFNADPTIRKEVDDFMTYAGWLLKLAPPEVSVPTEIGYKIAKEGAHLYDTIVSLLKTSREVPLRETAIYRDRIKEILGSLTGAVRELYEGRERFRKLATA